MSHPISSFSFFQYTVFGLAAPLEGNPLPPAREVAPLVDSNSGKATEVGGGYILSKEEYEEVNRKYQVVRELLLDGEKSKVEVQRVKDEYEAKLKEERARTLHFEAKMLAAMQKNRKLESTHNLTEKQRYHAEKRAEEQQELIRELWSKINDYSQNLSQEREQNNKSKDESRQCIAALAAENAALREKIKDHDGELNILEKMITETSKDYEKAIQRYSRKLTSAEAKLVSLEHHLNQKKIEMDKLYAELDRLKKEHHAAIMSK